MKKYEDKYNRCKKLIHIADDELSSTDKKILTELSRIQATELDVYYLRKDIISIKQEVSDWTKRRENIYKDIAEIIKSQDANHIKYMEKFAELTQSIRDSLHITVKNGKERVASVAEIALINYENNRIFRDINHIYSIIMDHKLISIIVITLAIMFNNKIVDVVNHIIQYIDSIRKLLIP